MGTEREAAAFHGSLVLINARSLHRLRVTPLPQRAGPSVQGRVSC